MARAPLRTSQRGEGPPIDQDRAVDVGAWRVSTSRPGELPVSDCPRSFPTDASCLQGARHMAKTCPLCRLDMSELTVDAILLDRCGACHGVWYDAKELRAYGKKMGVGRIARRLGKSATNLVPGMSCPNCPKQLLRRSDRDGITTYGCLECRGRFVSGTEMEKIRRRHNGHVIADGVKTVDPDREKRGVMAKLRGVFSR